MMSFKFAAVLTVTIQLIFLYVLYDHLKLSDTTLEYFSNQRRFVFNDSVTSINPPKKLAVRPMYPVKPVKVMSVDCSQLFQGNEAELIKARNLSSNSTSGITFNDISDLLNRTSNCWEFRRSRGYITSDMSAEEVNFPIAYSFVIHANPLQFEHLFRAVYRPQNTYCVHVDLKASNETFRAVKAILDCFPNAFLSSRRVKVEYPQASILEAQMVCIENLFNRSGSWKYFISLSGQEFPLKTNGELVKILKAFNGSNLVIGDTRKFFYNERFKIAGPPPHGLRPVKGMIYVAVTRTFVDFLLHDRRSRDLYTWALRTVRPEETYFGTLNYNPGLNIPGTYKLNTSIKPAMSSVIRYVHWGGPCKDGAEDVRGVCILGVNYLAELATTPHLFANKFYWDRERVSLECLDELLYNRTRDEYRGRAHFNATRYSTLDFVRNKI